MARRILFALACAVGWLLALTVALQGASFVSVAGGRPQATVRYVAPGGVCGAAVPCYPNVQAAVDAAAAGDEIRVAAGVYTGVSARAGVTQTAYISKTVAIRGGYTTGNWTTPNPSANPTTLDAAGQGRVLTIAGAISPTIEGLHLTNGRADTDDWYEGGGVYAITATVVLSNNWISNCYALYGGGIHLEGSPHAVLRGNQITDNEAGDEGGGISAWDSAGLTFADNQVRNNTAAGNAGGVILRASDDVTLTGNLISDNTATGDGGGLVLSMLFNAVLTGNQIVRNVTESNGGGAGIQGGGLVLQDNDIRDNSAAGSGGGVHFWGADAVTLDGNDIYGNHTDEGSGGGIAFEACSDALLTSNQVHDNAAYEGGGIYLAAGENSRMTGNAIYGNWAAGDGGGLLFSSGSNLVFSDNRVYGNRAEASGGGAYLLWASGSLTLAGNQVYSNTAATEGGGIACVSNEGVVMEANRIFDNAIAAGGGGGLYLVNCHGASLVNNALLRNRITAGDRPGIEIYADYVQDMRLLHTTIAGSGTGGSAIFVTDSILHGGPPVSSVALTNTILVSHTIGISVTAGNRVSLNGVLWYNTPITVSREATATVTVAGQYTGNPAFAPDGYHLTAGSAAIDRGVAAGVASDIDGEPRPRGAAADLGADETMPAPPATATPTRTPTASATTSRTPTATRTRTPTITPTGTVGPLPRWIYLPLVLR